MSRPSALPLLALLLSLAVVLSLGVGAMPIRPSEVVAILGSRLGLVSGAGLDERHVAVLLSIRLPRVLLAALVGGGLSVAGAALQGLFRNPLADPALLGVSGGAVLSTAFALVLGLGGLATAFGPAALALAAFAGGLLATLLVWRLASGEQGTSVASLLLAGLAVNALAGAGTGLLLFLADDSALRDIMFWTMGSFGGATWASLMAAGPLLLGACLLMLALGRPLNALLLGEAEAQHLGVDTHTLKRRVVILAALATGASVSVAGVIGFVGLLVPHLIRLALGPDHRLLLPCAALLGATLLVAADALARVVVAPAELPIGIVTTLLGAPCFAWLLRGRRVGAWT
jgi:iron complex transport system permease protein